MEALKETVEAIHNAGYKGKVKVMIGGAPITQAFSDQIEADAYAPDAGAAASIAIELVS